MLRKFNFSVPKKFQTAGGLKQYLSIVIMITLRPGSKMHRFTADHLKMNEVYFNIYVMNVINLLKKCRFANPNVNY